MANYINIYKGNPTAGGTDGVAVSADGSFTSPVEFGLNAAENESATQKLAIRAATGYRYINAGIQAASRYTLCKTHNGTFASAISFSEIGDTNSIFYIKASSNNTEPPQVIKTIKLNCFGKLQVVTP